MEQAYPACRAEAKVPIRSHYEHDAYLQEMIIIKQVLTQKILDAAAVNVMLDRLAAVHTTLVALEGYIMKNILLISVLWLTALVAQAGTTKITYYVNDALGSPVVAMNEVGAVTWRKTYAPYGKASGKDGDNRVGYTGHVEDSNGLVYAGGRYLDPDFGIFMSDDPVRFNEKNPMSFGRYTYANNNPYRFVDPDGRDTQEAEWAALDGTKPPDAAVMQVSENIAAGANTTAEMVDSVMPHSVGDVALQAVGVGVLRQFAKATEWAFGAFKSEAKWLNQMEKRGWTEDQISDAIKNGKSYSAENLVNKENSATRYVNNDTGRSVVIDDKTQEVIHVGGDGFKY